METIKTVILSAFPDKCAGTGFQLNLPKFLVFQCLRKVIYGFCLWYAYFSWRTSEFIKNNRYSKPHNHL